MEKHEIALFQTLDRAAAVQQVVGGHALEHHGSAGFERNRIGQLAHVLRRHHTQLAVAAGRLGGVGHAVAHFQVAHACAHGLHHAGGFHTQLQRQRQLVKAGALVDVDKVQADGMVAYAHLALTRLAHLHLDQLHLFGATITRYLYGQCHGFLLLLLRCCSICSHAATVFANLQSQGCTVSRCNKN